MTRLLSYELMLSDQQSHKTAHSTEDDNHLKCKRFSLFSINTATKSLETILVLVLRYWLSEQSWYGYLSDHLYSTECTGSNPNLYITL